MSLDTIINLNITIADAAVDQAGFGVPCVLDYNTVIGPELVRQYASTTAMITDGFGATDPAVRAVGAILSQNPKLPTVKVGRRTLADSQSVVFTVASVVANTDYTMNVNGTEITFNSGGSPTNLTIAAGLVPLITAISGVTATDNLDGTFDVDADTAGDVIPMFVENRSLLTQADATADAGIATDYAAVVSEDPDFYAVTPTTQSTAGKSALATAVETQRRILGVSSADDDCPTSGSGDLLSTLNTAGLNRTYGLYHPKSEVQYPAAAWMGERLPSDPGSSTWAYKTLAGVDFTVLTATEKSNIEGKEGNHYTEVGGVAITFEGKMASGRYIDVTRGIDWLHARIQERIFSLQVNLEKIPYTNGGIELVKNAIRAQLNEGISAGLLSPDLTFNDNTEAFTVTAPDVRDISDTDKANRLLPDIEFAARLAGAIHKVAIAGTVSV